MTKEIYLTKGYKTIVDDVDYQALGGIGARWFAVVLKGKIYAARSGVVNGKKCLTYLHRYILDAPDDIGVDHIDGDGLNNVRSNLRLANKSQNGANTDTWNNKPHTSKYRGVYRRSDTGKYVAKITTDEPGTRRHDRPAKYTTLGSFYNEEDAARAYNEAALARYGEFAVLNKVKD